MLICSNAIWSCPRLCRDGAVFGATVCSGSGERPQLFAVLVELCAAGALPSVAGRCLHPLPSSGRRRARPAVARAQTNRWRQQKTGRVLSEPPLRSGSAAGCGQGTDGQEVRMSLWLKVCHKKRQAQDVIHRNEIRHRSVWHVSDL